MQFLDLEAAISDTEEESEEANEDGKCNQQLGCMQDDLHHR